LQGNGLACPGGTGDQPVAIGQAHGLGNRLPREIGADNELHESGIWSPMVNLWSYTAIK
jgi:hypothetical protein